MKTPYKAEQVGSLLRPVAVLDARKAFLEGGRVGYQCVDTAGEAARTGGGYNCIHAVSDMDPAYDPARYPLLAYGIPASRRLTHEAARRGAFADPWVTHDWLIPRLGLDRHPIEWQEQPYKGIRRPIDPGPGTDTRLPD